jgi:hypothetical protein
MTTTRTHFAFRIDLWSFATECELARQSRENFKFARERDQEGDGPLDLPGH